MKQIIYGIILLISSGIYGQSSQSFAVEDSQTGWVKIYKYGAATASKNIGGRDFSVAHLSFGRTVANWMQASYVPKAGLGDIRHGGFGENGRFNEPYEEGFPYCYGASALTSSVHIENGKTKKIPGTTSYWGIYANKVPAEPEWTMDAISTMENCYFLLPGFSREDAKSFEQYNKDHDLSQTTVAKTFTYFWLKTGTGGGLENILLSKNNQFPFVKITKGEFLKAWETALPKLHDKEMKDISYKYSDDKGPLNIATKNENERHQKASSFIQALKERYKNRLNETAELNTLQHDRRDLAGQKDLFDPAGHLDMYPVYTVAPGMYELSKKDKPQWILIDWRWSMSDEKDKHMHESIIHNFNFEYLYNYFFEPEKVKGQPYKPLRSPYAKKEVIRSELSQTAKDAANDKTIHFFNDFSSPVTGQQPTDWSNTINGRGEYATVVSLGEADGKWALLNIGNEITPKNFKAPLPTDFTLSVDVAVEEKYKWGAGSLQIKLANEKTPGMEAASLLFNIRPGFNGREGEATVETKLPDGYAPSGKWYPMPGFSNNKKLNRITFSIKKKRGTAPVICRQNKNCRVHQRGSCWTAVQQTVLCT